MLPDYQGIGIATSLLNYIGDLYSKDKYQLNIVTSNPSVYHALRRSDKWALVRKGRYGNHSDKDLRKSESAKRLTVTFTYKKNVEKKQENKEAKASFFNEFKSFCKEVKGNEGNKCHYPTRLDTYGCGCYHDCKYCYAKSLLNFRGLWDADNPKVADVKKIEGKLKKIPKGTILRLGGMTDCFQPCELEHRVTLETIKLLNKYGIGYLIVTKSHIVANDEYMQAMDKDLAHIQITVTTLDDDKSLEYERASIPSKRVEAILKLQEQGFDVAIRLSPLMEEYMDIDKLNTLGINNCVIEFLRANHWIKQWFKIDYSKYAFHEGNYDHLTLEQKKRIVELVKIPNKTICEDVTAHYEYWKENVNPNKNDCCNLRRVENG